MSEAKKKYEEFVRRVGNSEPHFCGRQQCQTQHLLIQEKEEAKWGEGAHYHFYLVCKECGLKAHIFEW